MLDPEVPVLLDAVLGVPCNTAGNRLDLVGLLSPFGTVAADLLRINIEDDQTFANSSFPNGRWLEDDVTDVILTAACNGDFSVPVADGVNANDQPFAQTFPYLPAPYSGNPL